MQPSLCLDDYTVEGIVQTVDTLSAWSILYLPKLNVPVKVIARHFIVTTAHDEDSETFQTQRDAKGSREYW